MRFRASWHFLLRMFSSRIVVVVSAGAHCHFSRKFVLEGFFVLFFCLFFFVFCHLIFRLRSSNEAHRGPNANKSAEGVAVWEEGFFSLLFCILSSVVLAFDKSVLLDLSAAFDTVDPLLPSSLPSIMIFYKELEYLRTCPT